jgi:hypothetical protein
MREQSDDEGKNAILNESPLISSKNFSGFLGFIVFIFACLLGKTDS